MLNYPDNVTDADIERWWSGRHGHNYRHNSYLSIMRLGIEKLTAEIGEKVDVFIASMPVKPTPYDVIKCNEYVAEALNEMLYDPIKEIKVLYNEEGL